MPAKDTIKALAGRLGFQISRATSADVAAFQAIITARSRIGTASDELADFLQFCLDHASQSNSQIFQDIFVLYETASLRNGYFVEFGGADGLELSNTLLLERSFGWTGIVGEPARGWHDALIRNRTCAVDLRCVSDTSGQTVLFNESEDMVLSTIDDFSALDSHRKSRANGRRYEVETVSLNDLLTHHATPSRFDYLSIDTEGSEFIILGALDFDRFRPRVITVEHNYTDRRRDIYNLLVGTGYRRKFDTISGYDDWYVDQTA